MTQQKYYWSREEVERLPRRIIAMEGSRSLTMVRITILCIFLFTNSLATEVPPLEEGNVEGAAGILYAPTFGNALLPLEECTVILEPRSGDRYQYRKYPCGTWFAPPAGRYDAWLELPGHVTAEPVVTSYARSPFTGKGHGVDVDVVPAGTVRAEQIPKGAHTFRVLAEAGPVVYQRRVLAHQALAGVRVPAGNTCVVGFFTEDDEVIALSAPVTVKQGQPTVATLRVPETGSDLLVILRKRPADSAPLPLRLEEGNTVIAPDVRLESDEWLFGIWYGLRTRHADLSIDDYRFAIPELRPKRVTSVRAEVPSRAIIEN